MDLIITNKVIPTIYTSDARDLKENMRFFSEKSSLTSSHCPCSFLCHVTFVTAFYKCFDIVVKPAKSTILYFMNNLIQQQQMFHIFLLK